MSLHFAPPCHELVTRTTRMIGLMIQEQAKVSLFQRSGVPYRLLVDLNVRCSVTRRLPSGVDTL